MRCRAKAFGWVLLCIAAILVGGSLSVKAQPADTLVLEPENTVILNGSTDSRAWLQWALLKCVARQLGGCLRMNGNGREPVIRWRM